MKVSKRLALSAAAIATVGIAAPSFAGKPSAPSEPTTCGNTDVQLSISQNLLWPPNHKMIPITVTASDSESDRDHVSVTIGQITNSDETNGIDINGTGKPDTTPYTDETGSNQTKSFDDPGSATFGISLAAERSGHDRGNGRTYSIPVTCTETGGMDPNDTGESLTGRMGTATLTVFVPHDQGNNE